MQFIDEIVAFVVVDQLLKVRTSRRYSRKSIRGHPKMRFTSVFSRPTRANTDREHAENPRLRIATDLQLKFVE